MFRSVLLNLAWEGDCNDFCVTPHIRFKLKLFCSQMRQKQQMVAERTGNEHKAKTLCSANSQFNLDATTGELQMELNLKTSAVDEAK
jgi:hypothetical protein